MKQRRSARGKHSLRNTIAPALGALSLLAIFQPLPALAAKGDSERLEGTQIHIKLANDQGKPIELRAEKFIVLGRELFRLAGHVEIVGARFVMHADRADVIFENNDYSLSITGNPASFIRKNGDRLEAELIEYDSRTHLATFSKGVKVSGSLGNFSAAKAVLNTESHELVSP